MIYITFDTNIWIYLLDDSWKLNADLDQLEYWIEQGDVEILLPKIIKDEWYKHQDKQTVERKKTLNNFFKTAEEILPTAFYKEYKTPDSINKIINQQLERINQLINKAHWIDLNQEIRDKVLIGGVERKAPQHCKSSVADAIIIHSLFNFAEKNKENRFYFITANKDDFVLNKQIHPDLSSDFERLNVKWYNSFNELVYRLKSESKLHSSPNLESRRKQTLKYKIQEQIYNPHYEGLAQGVSNLFSQNKKMLDFILEEDIPTKEQVIFVLSLIDSDKDYEKYFYGKVKGKAWFNILYQKGIYNYKNNPAGHQFWMPLLYLQKLVTEETDDEIIQKIITIITDVCEKSHSNSYTWSQFVQILVAIPSKLIPIELFDYVPKWIAGENRSSAVVRNICDKLIPKLYQESPKRANKKKIECIIKHFLSISYDEEIATPEFSFDSKYQPVLFDLLNTFDDRLITIIANSCAKEIILFLINQLKRIYYDYPNGVSFSITKDDEDIKAKIVVDVANRNIEVFPEKGKLFTIPSFDTKTESAMIYLLSKNLSEQGYDIEPDDDEFLDLTIRSLINGHSFLFGSYGIDEYETLHKDNRPEIAFVVLLRKLLNEYIKEQPKKGLSLLTELFNKNEYQLAPVRQVCFYVIGENWELSQTIFLDLLEKGELDRYLHNSAYNTDLGRFFRSVQHNINSSTTDKLDAIISNPPKDDKYETAKYWQARWYAALRGVDTFKEKYDRLSKELKLDDRHFDKEGRTQMASGERSPKTASELLEMTNEEILNYVTAFKPKNGFGEPSVYGLGKTLQEAVKIDPERFSEQILDFISLPYIHISHMFYGLYYAWLEKGAIYWENVIDFMLNYVKDERFYANQLQIEYDARADADWCVGIFSNLLQEGMKNDEHSLDKKLLPKVKELLMIFASYIKAEDRGSNSDYVNASLNTTSGKILKALLDYSLFRARNGVIESNERWEKDVLNVFEKSLEDKLIDSFVVIGMYYRQFLYLSAEWTEQKAKSFQILRGKYWKAFWSGYLFSGYVPNVDDYQEYVPHYRRAIQAFDSDEKMYGGGITKHITSFYFWGYEDLEDDGLVAEFCRDSSATTINDFVNYVSNQDEYLSLLKTEEEKVEFESSIVALWKVLVSRFTKQRDEKGKEVLSRLSALLSLVRVLNTEVTDLVLASSPIIEKSYSVTSLLEDLLKLCNSGTPVVTAKHVGEIIASIPVNSFSLYRNDEIKDILVFLFENGQKNVALTFCDDRVRAGDESFNVLIDKYK